MPAGGAVPTAEPGREPVVGDGLEERPQDRARKAARCETVEDREHPELVSGAVEPAVPDGEPDRGSEQDAPYGRRHGEPEQAGAGPERAQKYDVRPAREEFAIAGGPRSAALVFRQEERSRRDHQHEEWRQGESVAPIRTPDEIAKMPAGGRDDAEKCQHRESHRNEA